ncbi:uncharacterized protein LOC143204319 isoform X1 [Rhynchophorus ferrugineus]|uniref:uncharacterized protein LOC143204319 isoform X1 n=1 Tax=Rhynchophorus ferrugineus TaxID=354439 RepID=UPI003FCE3DCF
MPHHKSGDIVQDVLLSICSSSIMDSLKQVIYDPKKNEPFYFTLAYLRVLKYYPNSSDYRNFKRHQALAILYRMISTFVCWECFLHIFMSIKNGPYVNITDDIVGVTGVANCFYYGAVFQYSNKRWSKFFSDLTDTVQFGTPPGMDKIAKENNRFSMIFGYFCISGCLLYSAISLIDTENCERSNLQKNAHEICGMITPIWWPTKEIDPLLKGFMLIYQFICVLLIIPGSAMFFFLPLESARLLSVKYKHLRELIHQLFEHEDDGNKMKRLGQCIRYHQELLRLAEELNQLIKVLFGHVSVVGAVALSTIGYYMLEQYYAVIHIISYTVGLYLLCAGGQMIKDETSNLCENVYMANWYKDLKLAKNLKFIMQRSYKAVVLESYMFGDLDMILFVAIVKTTYSYLTLLSSINFD